MNDNNHKAALYSVSQFTDISPFNTTTTTTKRPNIDFIAIFVIFALILVFRDSVSVCAFGHLAIEILDYSVI